MKRDTSALYFPLSLVFRDSAGIALRLLVTQIRLLDPVARSLSVPFFLSIFFLRYALLTYISLKGEGVCFVAYHILLLA